MGHPVSEETKQKMSKALKGRTYGSPSEEAKENMSEAAKNRKSPSGFIKGDPKICGENNPNWKGGASTESQKMRASSETATWRKFVFERDDYTCQECLLRGGELRAHHCKSFAEYPHLRFQTWNGLTLCKECHKRYHGGIG